MRETLNLPKLGDSTEDVLVISWEAEVGDVLAEGDALMTVETDKVEADVPTPVAGTLVARLVEENQEVAVGSPVAVIER